jgi:hypothetical protein|tara:strand:+ start:332 stop:511 length:180 start_codon:yes stop_codon:yes gene_type:complete
MTKNIEWKAEIKIQWEDGTIEKIEEFDFSDDLISQIDYEIKDYKESKEIYKEERTNNDI